MHASVFSPLKKHRDKWKLLLLVFCCCRCTKRNAVRMTSEILPRVNVSQMGDYYSTPRRGNFWARAATASSLLPCRQDWDAGNIYLRRSVPKWAEWERGLPGSTFCTFYSLLSPSVGDLQCAIGQLAAWRWSDWNENHHLNVWGNEGALAGVWEGGGAGGKRLELKTGGFSNVADSCTSGTKNRVLKCSAAINGKPSAQLNKSTDQWQYTSLRRADFCNNACLSIIAIFHPPGN